VRELAIGLKFVQLLITLKLKKIIEYIVRKGKSPVLNFSYKFLSKILHAYNV